jgi:hypothetical protein
VLTSPSNSAVPSTSSRFLGESSADCFGRVIDVSFTSLFEIAVTAPFAGVLFAVTASLSGAMLESAVAAVSLPKGASDDIAMI